MSLGMLHLGVYLFFAFSLFPCLFRCLTEGGTKPECSHALITSLFEREIPPFFVMHVCLPPKHDPIILSSIVSTSPYVYVLLLPLLLLVHLSPYPALLPLLLKGP